MFRKLLGLCLLLALAGCASTQVANTELLEQQAIRQANESQLTPEEAVAQAQHTFDTVDSPDLRRCAPLHMQKAEESLSKAKQLLAGGEPVALVLEQSFQTQRLLEAAQTTAALVHEKLSASLAHRKVLDELDVQAELPKEYSKVMNKLQNIIQEVEAGFVDKAVAGESKVLAAMTELEVDALKHRYMTPVNQVLDQAYDADADEYAEATLEVAQLKIKDANQFIETNYRDRDGVKHVAEEALAAAEHALYVARDSVRLMDLEPEQAEQWVLKMEALLEEINHPMNQGPVTGRSLEDQAYSISRRVKSLYDRGATAFATEENVAPLSIEAVPADDSGAEAAMQPETVADDAATADSAVDASGTEKSSPTKVAAPVVTPVVTPVVKPEVTPIAKPTPSTTTAATPADTAATAQVVPQAEPPKPQSQRVMDESVASEKQNAAVAAQAKPAQQQQKPAVTESETGADEVYDDATVEQQIEAGTAKQKTAAGSTASDSAAETEKDKTMTEDGWTVD